MSGTDRLSSKNWFGKASAGAVLGLALALALACLFVVITDGETRFTSPRGMFAMWMISPVWAGVLSFCFLFRSGWRAWGWLGLANILGWSAVLLAKGTLA